MPLSPDVDRARIWGVMALNGSFHFGTDFVDVPSWQGVNALEMGWSRAIANGELRRLGVRRFEGRGFDVGAPVPLVLLLTGTLPVAWGRRWWLYRQQAKRRTAGQCLLCGYDLRGSPDRCPECGRATS